MINLRKMLKISPARSQPETVPENETIDPLDDDPSKRETIDIKVPLELREPVKTESDDAVNESPSTPDKAVKQTKDLKAPRTASQYQ